ncbi:hypothetical protein jhhlp_001398 [Lomentospora prolificans]|uniref:Lysophospholipase n=1 Tax=Lomentospora prolificans TaxID=41688 RepID=A0A2N3NI62_9PEZI|nr:hypothetical protein jhhlp_001398 [Lomentospora prolificans]
MAGTVNGRPQEVYGQTLPGRDVSNPEIYRGITIRASPDAPNGYAPARVDCPASRPSARTATDLSANETQWQPTRRNNTLDGLKSFFNRVAIQGFDANGFFDQLNSSDPSTLPTLGIAVSGGGYRALMNGAGVLSAFDERSNGSTDASMGAVGGVLQSAMYLSGLSGGSWLVGSLYVQNFSTVGGVLDGNATKGIWQFNQSIFQGPEDIRTLTYFRAMRDTVAAKQDAGFNTTITDFWGRALSYQLVSPVDGGPAYTFSSIANDGYFTAGSAPLPIVVAVERAPGQAQINLNSTVIEFNPWEMGSHDQAMSAFAPLRYIGSNFSDGTVPANGSCVRGFDNVGFTMGTSSSLFNAAYLGIEGKDSDGTLTNFIESRLREIGQENRDVALWPNPFWESSLVQSRANQSFLTLVDGGLALENVPIQPLLWERRGVDVIIAVDSSADTSDNWPNGTALVATYQRSREVPNNASFPFPKVPDQNTFVNEGLNSKPTFFGCPAPYTNETVADGTPLVVYLPNAPYTFFSNVSTLTMSYTDAERNSIVMNGVNVATMGQGKLDDRWPACLGCAILARSLARQGSSLPGECANCFKKYCWNGTVDSSTPPSYDPNLIIKTNGAAGAQGWDKRLVMLGLGFSALLYV